ncbi:MAG: hypothetical protein U5N86_05135 [Planctomycetota bacterium]|nr:hypothetical protein [Planctomycetota bacterium]
MEIEFRYTPSFANWDGWEDDISAWSEGKQLDAYVREMSTSRFRVLGVCGGYVVTPCDIMVVYSIEEQEFIQVEIDRKTVVRHGETSYLSSQRVDLMFAYDAQGEFVGVLKCD